MSVKGRPTLGKREVHSAAAAWSCDGTVDPRPLLPRTEASPLGSSAEVPALSLCILNTVYSGNPSHCHDLHIVCMWNIRLRNRPLVTCNSSSCNTQVILILVGARRHVSSWTFLLEPPTGKISFKCSVQSFQIDLTDQLKMLCNRQFFPGDEGE